VSKVIETMVCVGGPMAGMRWKAEGGVRSIRVAIDYGRDHGEYLQERIAGRDVVFSFWRWAEMPIDEAIGELFSNYVPPAPKAP